MASISAAFNAPMGRRVNSHTVSKKTSSSASSADLVREFEEQTMPLMPQLFGMAKRLTRHEQDAEDLLQDTYVKAFAAWHQFEQGTNLKAWLYRIMHNSFLNTAVKRNKSQNDKSLDALEDWQTGDADSLTASATRSAEAEAIDNLPSKNVVEALDSLPEEFREVVLQAVVLGLPYAEIAKNMNTPIGTVMSRLHRGKKILRDKLTSFAIDEGYSVNSEGKGE